MKHNRIVISVGIVGLAALLSMLAFMSPTNIGPFGVLLFFTTLYVVIFCISSLLFQGFKRMAFKNSHQKSKDYLYSAILAFGPIMLMMARSFGAINLWTILLMAIFLFLAEFLVAKRV